MPLKKSDTQKDQLNRIPLTIKKPKIDKYNESYEDTLNNIHALTMLNLKMFGRLGYQIKLMEEIKNELTKLNKLVEKP